MKNVIKKAIKKAFYEYRKTMKQSASLTVEWAERNMAVDYGKVNVQTSSNNVMETKICALMDENLKKVRWCYVVEKVLDHYHFEQDKIKFIEMIYFDKKSEVDICVEVCIGRATFYRWQEEILEIAYKWAKELKLIKE